MQEGPVYTTQLAELCKTWKAHSQHASVKIETDEEMGMAVAEDVEGQMKILRCVR